MFCLLFNRKCEKITIFEDHFEFEISIARPPIDAQLALEAQASRSLSYPRLPAANFRKSLGDHSLLLRPGSQSRDVFVNKAIARIIGAE